jgi:hypothetical protein
VIDPIQSFLNGGQRAIYDEAVGLLAASANNLSYLRAGSDAEMKRLLDDPNAFRGNRMTQLKQAAEALGKQIEEALATSRAVVVEAIAGRKTEVLGSAYYGSATEEAQERVVRTIDQIIARVGSEKQIALIREQGNSFEETIYPSLLDQLVFSARPTGGAETGDLKPVKQTISVKTITVPGARGVLEYPEDVDPYLEALRGVLLSTLADGKRIAL